ncbi:hypothetical protein [Streptomyces sp. CoH27]|uniref:hypothetical protein n=1 Tax=Streptomyces sp. CoH27 TaxID=2875763 RepID=UPI001CD32042|nr:hypothetical protein [Streptomyces sp. CoH27]
MVKTETPRDADGAKLCAWCGGSIKQSGVGRSRDYCKRLCREQAYRKRRDQRLIDEALAAAAPVSSTGETAPDVSPVDETRVSPVVERPSEQVKPVIPAPTPPPPPRRSATKPLPPADDPGDALFDLAPLEDPGAELERRLARWLGPEDGDAGRHGP